MDKTELKFNCNVKYIHPTNETRWDDMNFPAFSMFVEYVCEECKIKELDVEIIPETEMSEM